MTAGVLVRAPAGPPGVVTGPGRIVLALVVLVAFAVRLRLLTHGAGLASSDGYDDGVYSAAADALVHGRLPYRDFLLLHPPGILLALAPFAAIGSVVGDPAGVALARLAFVGIGAASSGMIAVVAGRHSRTAAVIAGGSAALLLPLAWAERSTLLEPLGTALLLAAVLLLRRTDRWSHVIAGCLAGAAVGVKIWYVVPLLVLIASRRRGRSRLLVGGVFGAAAVIVPFLLADPAAMVREVVLDQLGRPRSAGATLPVRLLTIAGDPTSALHGPLRVPALVLGLLIGVALLAGAAVCLRIPWARVFAALAAATGVVLLASPSFYLHYAAFTLPWAAICAGVGWADLAARTGRPAAWRVVAVALLGLVAAASLPGDLHAHAVPQPVQALRPFLARTDGCVVSDDPGLLADAGVLTRDLEQACPLWPDVTGWTYDRDRVHGVQRTANRRYQAHVLAYLTSGDLVVLARAGTGLSKATLRRIHRLPVVLDAGPRGVVRRVR